MNKLFHMNATHLSNMKIKIYQALALHLKYWNTFIHFISIFEYLNLIHPNGTFQRILLSALPFSPTLPIQYTPYTRSRIFELLVWMKFQPFCLKHFHIQICVDNRTWATEEERKKNIFSDDIVAIFVVGMWWMPNVSVFVCNIHLFRMKRQTIRRYSYGNTHLKIIKYQPTTFFPPNCLFFSSRVRLTKYNSNNKMIQIHDNR